MTTAERDREGRALTGGERAAWNELEDRYRDELRYGLFRALFDDVRPAWEEHLAGRPPVAS